jgi:C4-dicarboxylate transporter
MEESIIYQTASRKEHTIKSNMLKKKAEQKGSPNVYNFLGHFPLILTLHFNFLCMFLYNKLIQTCVYNIIINIKIIRIKNAKNYFNIVILIYNPFSTCFYSSRGSYLFWIFIDTCRNT